MVEIPSGGTKDLRKVRSGYAFDWPRYSKKKYAEDEEYAKTNKLGLWTMEFEYPWIWKKNK